MRFVVPSLGGGDARIEGRNRSWVSRFAAVALWWCGALAEGNECFARRHGVVLEAHHLEAHVTTLYPNLRMETNITALTFHVS